MFKVIVAGGRDFNNYKGLSDSLDYLLKNINDDIQIVCGMARGADRLGERYAKEHGYSTSPPIGISKGSPQDSNGM